MGRTNLATTIAVNFRYFIKILSYCCILEKQAVTLSDEKNPTLKHVKNTLDVVTARYTLQKDMES